METVTKRLYEAMFLVDSGEAAADFQGVLGHISKVLNRSGAEMLSIRKWDDRVLAYEVEGRKRGTYILAYFNVESDKISAMERDFQLSEIVLRVLILRADNVSSEDMAKDTPVMAAEKAQAASAEEADAKNADAKNAEAADTEAAEDSNNDKK